MVTPHAETSRDSLNWKNPNEFDPEPYKQAPTRKQNDEAKAKQRSCLHGYLLATLGGSDLYEFKNL
jgi:hypothetical protein